MTAQIAAYLHEFEARGLSAATVRLTRGWLERFALYCREQQVTLFDVSPAVLAAYHTRLLWQPHTRGRLFTPHSVDQALRHVRAFLRWAVAHGYLAADPTQHLVLERPVSRPRPTWSQPEQEAILALPDPHTPLGRRDRALLGLFFEAALSWPQCSGLDLADLDPAGYSLATHRGRRRKGPLSVVLSDGLAELFCDYLAHGRPKLAADAEERALFLNGSGRRFQPLHLAAQVRAYLRQAASSLNRRP